MSFAERVQGVSVAGDERLFFRMTPAFQLTFSLYCFFQGVARLDVDDFEWPALRGMARGGSSVMRSLARLWVVSMPDVQALVGAAKDVDVPHQTTMSRQSRSGRD